MSSILLGKGYYDRLDFDPVPLENMLFERCPVNVQDQVSLISRPGMAEFGSITSSAFPSAGAFRALAARSFNYQSGGYNEMIAVHGNAIVTFRLRTTDAAVTSQDSRTTALTQTGAAQIAVGFDHALVTDYNGDGTSTALYSVELDNGNNATTTSPGTGDTITCVAYFASRFYIGCLNGRIFWSDLLGDSFGALDFITAEYSDDGVVALARLGDELACFQSQYLEWFYSTGESDAPIGRIPGRVYQVGCADRDTVLEIGGALYFVGIEEGVLGVFKTDGGKPVRVSDATVDEMLRGATLNTLSAFEDGFDGRALYTLRIPGVGDPCLDTSTGLWSLRKTYLNTNFRAWRSAQLSDGSWILCDSATKTAGGRMLKVRPDLYQDAGVQIVRVATGIVDSKGPGPLSNVLLDCSAGRTASETTVEMEFSDDRGRSFASAGAVSLGTSSNVPSVVSWRRLRAFRRAVRTFRWTYRGNGPWTINRASFNESNI